jgi:hypothetical protein
VLTLAVVAAVSAWALAQRSTVRREADLQVR